MVMGGDRKGIEGLSFHNIENAFWNISFGANGYGIYQPCPPENLHSLKEGLFKYLLKELVDQLSGKQKALAELDSLFQEISEPCKYHSDCNFPCMSFPFRFSNISKVTGDEKEGLLIVMILLMESVSGKGDFKRANLSGVLFHGWVHLFQEVLWYNCWISKEEYDCKTLSIAEDNVCLLLATFKAVLNRIEGYRSQPFLQMSCSTLLTQKEEDQWPRSLEGYRNISDFL